MIRRSPAVLTAAVLALWCLAGAHAADSSADIRAALAFQTALKAGDRNMVARIVAYPVVRDFPLPPVKSTGEFLASWDQFFDTANLAALLRSKPEQIGWQ